MTPKEKAKELKDNFQKQVFFDVTDERLDINEAKGLALLAVDEILKNVNYFFTELKKDGLPNKFDDEIEYWQEVKQEINKL